MLTLIINCCAVLFDSRDNRSQHGEKEPRPSIWQKINPPTPALEDIAPTYRSTPILSGLIIPFAILLEIPGLVQYWYIRTDDNQVVETRSNPPILQAGLALSIVCAVIANVALIMRFMEKRVKTSTLICIVFLTIHDIINVIAITVFGIEHSVDDGFTYGQPYWMIVGSTAVSLVTNVTLIFDLIHTPDFPTAGSGLTRKQRSLIIAVMILLCYVALGAGIHVVLIDLSFVDALYFTVACVETIGFGDIVPKGASRVWVCAYVVFGAFNLGLVVKLARETLLEAIEVGHLARLEHIRQRRLRRRRYQFHNPFHHRRHRRRNRDLENAVRPEEIDEWALMEEEEKQAFWVRLIITWTLFVVFWMVGSALFMRAEEWSFGTAMYFCFVCFSTIGFGDYTPHTPAGRALFVVWAILGVAAMTILISMMSEAYSDRYNNAIQSSLFMKAAKEYRAKVQSSSTPQLPPDVKDDLEFLHEHILSHARLLRSHLHFFASSAQHEIPEGLLELMDEIQPGSEKLHVALKKEILADETARQTMLGISIDAGLGRIIGATEEARTVLEQYRGRRTADLKAE